MSWSDFATGAPWLWWLSAAAVLAILEIVVPGVFLIFIAAAAAVTGVIVLLIPSLPVVAQAALLAGLSAASVAVGRRWYRANPVATSDPLLNERSMRMLGEIVVVEEPIVGGQGRVRVGDGAWLARGPDAPAGARMQVVGVADTVLLVEPANAAA